MSSQIAPSGKPPACSDEIAAHQKRRADAEGAAPGVLGGLEHVEEDALIVDPALGCHQIVLDRIGVEEELRRLDHAGALIVEEPDGAAQDIRLHGEIRIENEDKRRVGETCRVRQRIVEIAGLGAGIIRPRDVICADLGAIALEPIAPRVVADPECVVRVIDRERRDDRALDDVERLVIAADENVDRGPICRDA